MTEWSWATDDFAALWYDDARDRFPSPLRYTSRFRLRDEFAAHRAAVFARYGVDERDEIDAALGTLADAEIRIEILGGSSRHRQSTGPEDVRQYRIVGARTGFRAVVAVQYGTDSEHGPIRLRMSRVEDLPGRLVAAIPGCAAGSAGAETFHPDDLRPSRDSYLEENGRNTPRDRYRRLLGRAADGGGSAVLLVGPSNRLGAPLAALQWYDISGDGRYTERRGAHVSVRPTTTADLVSGFSGWIGRAEQRLREES
ncbi:ESX secretion-associated protein EspG [Nocardia harenae]|uniref:ESX secretion-associated protein EspG n=1 Tax=Nocardia harenae TaxID=358707 RepID=UPI0008365472|nr:ESX secretion-associated protein EspG [Nocardia harenae]